MEKMTVNNEAFFGNVITLLRKGKKVTIPVKGTSMLPFIVGEVDLVVLEGVEAASPENLPHRNAAKGDIVLFRVNNHFILHRILEFDANGVAVIQGDGILRAKEHCGRDGIFGRVVSVLKQGKHPVDVESNGYRLKIRLWLMAAPFPPHIARGLETLVPHFSEEGVILRTDVQIDAISSLWVMIMRVLS